ncbi:vasorin-like isoform X2 [Dreissena polymorpha]|uniref:vasorin-like isoform X2 n=1 Tax=Dreissena polymorpha TaxID=45954 RepID=UPI0022647E87|nr:vasorin-like isoform X2 [Dreissena polymorpha]
MTSPFYWCANAHVLFVAALWLVNPASLMGFLSQSSDKTANFTGQGLSQVPTGDSIPDDTENIDLSENSISNLTLVGYNNLKSLKTFNISRNQISELTPNAFKDLTALMVLDLSRNNIKGELLEEHMFVDLRKLETLNLEQNPMLILKSNVFNFMELPSLKRLDVSHCDIFVLERSSIDLPTLEYLDLSWNALTKVNKEAFRMMADLKTLDMSHNRIKVLDTVPYLPAIQTWNLDSNLIEEVHIKDQIWQRADTIENLYLRNNKIMRFGPDDLPLDLVSLKVISLEQNDINCDCRMKWIADDADIPSLETRNITITCRFPTRLAKREVLLIAANEFTGTCSAQVTSGMLVAIIVTSVIGVVCLAFGIYVAVKTIQRRRKFRFQRLSADDGEKINTVSELIQD